MIRRNVTINTKQVAYWENNGQRPEVVILLHGLGGDHRGLVPLTSRLNKFRLLMPDLPGYGLSDPLIDEHSIINYVAFLDSFRKEIGLRKFYLIGHSFGGAIALMYAKIHPAQIIKVGLLNPALGGHDKVSWKLGRRYAKFAGFLPDKMCHFLLCNKLTVYFADRALMTSEGKEYRKKILSQDYLNYHRASTRALKESITALDDLAIDNFIPDRHTDLFILFGKKDRLVTPEFAAKFSSLLKQPLVGFLAGGHLLPLEDPKTVGNFINQSLNSS
ncbi:MAG TPA: alpha/beta hydrolase [Candidatus Saccharimonadales bacterium]|jgi:pimeloyl-ACP methyl ester carboxylesterase|nr:alpha/beta hydrolase [Candidatus Saccharimonadales bacterium]